MMNSWPSRSSAPYLSAPQLPPTPSVGTIHPSVYVKPKVGLGVICRCQPTCVECLLVKRGPNFVSPLKWSFPGGRLDKDKDLEDDGEIGTERELRKECGGGTPHGLPPLIHIECYKSGKTLYHVYVVDWEAQPDWLRWLPRNMPDHTGDIDTTSQELSLRGQVFHCEKGFCWVDLQTLIEECLSIGNNDQEKINSSILQHGLIRWINVNGENILKTLIARSPKLAHTRRYNAAPSNSYFAPPTSSGGKPSPVFLGANTWRATGDSNSLAPPSLLTAQLFRPSVHYGMPLMHQSTILSQQDQGVQQQQQQQQDPTSLPGLQNASYTQPTSTGSSINVTGQVPDIEPPAHSTSGQSRYHIETPEEEKVANVDTSQNFSITPGGSYYFNPFVSSSSPIAATTTAPSQNFVFHPTGGLGHMHQLTTPPSLNDMGSGRSFHRKETPCKYFLQGHCPYGYNCWFLHTMDSKPKQREPLLGPGGVLTSPLHPITPQHGMWQPNFFSPEELAVAQLATANAVFSPPQSPMGAGSSSAVNPSTLPVAAGTQPLLPLLVRGGLPMGTGQSGQIPVFRPMMFQAPTVPYFQHQPAVIPNVHDPGLRFKLLSEVVFQDSSNAPSLELSQMVVRADHFYASFGTFVRDYKVLFGGDRKNSETHVLTSEQKFEWPVSCLHCSKLMPSLVVVGMENGSIFVWDLKKGGSNSILLPVHETDPACSEGAITALVHFTTTVSGAQVIVAGSKMGVVTWYIAQPPMKTFTILTTEAVHSPSPIISLQIIGSCLLSGSNSGLVCLWSMCSREPILTEKFQAHSESLMDIYALDVNTFLTIGMNKKLSSGTGSPKFSQLSVQTEKANDLPPGPDNSSSVTTGTIKAAPTDDPVAALASNLSQFTFSNAPSSNPVTESATKLNGSHTACVWAFGQPVQNISTIDYLGLVSCTSFHQQPMFGNRFLAVGQANGKVKVFNIPQFSVASEVYFHNYKDLECRFVALNLSREKENTHFVNVKNPFRDLILTTAWSDGRIMVCQTDGRKGSP